MLNQFKSVLVLAPHTDDAELGAGGTVSKLISEGVEVHCAAFSTCGESIPEGYPNDALKNEFLSATSSLGYNPSTIHIYNFQVRKFSYQRQEILEELIKLRSNIDPDLVLLPSPNDVHQDHATISREGIRAFKKTTILGYELVWNNLNFNTCAFVQLDRKMMEAKIFALSKYESQKGRDYMSKDFIFSLARTRGVQIGVEFAECFEVIRWVME